MSLTVVDAGALMLIEDQGRPGHLHLGVSTSGAADRISFALANRLVGNAQSSAALEVVGSFAVRVSASTWFAVTGAWGRLWLDGRQCDPYAALYAAAGSVVRAEAPLHGLRYYLAVCGGIEAVSVLGSRSTDTLSGLGPAPLAAGDAVAIGDQIAGEVPKVDTAVIAAPQSDGECIELAAVEGPRSDWFTAEARAAFYGAEWVVSARASRVGVALEPAHGAVDLQRVSEGELASEAMLPGAVQVPPAGTPTVLGADHPATGGYPVIAVVEEASLDLLAQARPGQRVRFLHRATPAIQ